MTAGVFSFIGLKALFLLILSDPNKNSLSNKVVVKYAVHCTHNTCLQNVNFHIRGI